jgi:hypothetical protein
LSKSATNWRRSEEDRNAFAAAIVERGGGMVKRRKLLGGICSAGDSGSLASSRCFRCLRSLGPLPKGTLFHTDWKKGTYRRRHRQGVASRSGTWPLAAMVTVYPEGQQNTDRGQAVDQTVLIRSLE